jgi:hypothetical protein
MTDSTLTKKETAGAAYAPQSGTPITIGNKDLPYPTGDDGVASGRMYGLQLLGGDDGQVVNLVWCGADLKFEGRHDHVIGDFAIISLDEYEWEQFFSTPAVPQLQIPLTPPVTELETITTTGQTFPDHPLFALVVQDQAGNCVAVLTFPAN